jgi:hypothetical protein
MLKRTKNVGWRFFQKPVGLELYFLKPELTFTFFLFIFFVAGCSLCGLLYGMFLLESAIKHPQAPQKKMIVAIAEIIIFRGAKSAVLRQSNSHGRTGTERSFCEVERSTASVKRRGKNISQPLAFLDLGQSEVFTERSQPRWLCERATAENTEGGRHNTAGMQ